MPTTLVKASLVPRRGGGGERAPGNEAMVKAYLHHIAHEDNRQLLFQPPLGHDSGEKSAK